MTKSDQRDGRRRARKAHAVVVAALIVVCGCDSPNAEFSFNRLFVRYQETQGGDIKYAPEQTKAIVNAVAGMFGTPDEPEIPDIEGLGDVLDMQRVQAAAGPVHSDEYGNGEGLYRQHCVHCHGISGNGRGPTAKFLNPYPRDFTRGTFKFKSTPIGYKPTHEDLRRTLMTGINGTAMPSFQLLSEGEVEALVDYVKYLAIRGEVERKLIELNQDFYDVEDPSQNDALLAEFHSPEFLRDEVLMEVVTSWTEAEGNVTEVEGRPAVYDSESDEFDQAELVASQKRGRTLYYNSVANCFSCHGPSQLGDGQMTDYDQWTKEFFDWTNTNVEGYDEKVAEYIALGDLPPRNIIPRNLRKGIYRGGRRPVDLFWRVHNGIDGTPMPAANKAALNDGDLWDIVNYVLSLPYEPTSQPGLGQLTNVREVN